jgi:hypothetical protein
MMVEPRMIQRSIDAFLDTVGFAEASTVLPLLRTLFCERNDGHWSNAEQAVEYL